MATFNYSELTSAGANALNNYSLYEYLESTYTVSFTQNSSQKATLKLAPVGIISEQGTLSLWATDFNYGYIHTGELSIPGYGIATVSNLNIDYYDLLSYGLYDLDGSFSDKIIGSAYKDVYYGGAMNDEIFGNGGDDNLYGDSGNDTLSGGSGNDLLVGGTGEDSLSGGIGDDTYYIDSTSDTIAENYLEGTDKVYSSVNFTLSSNLESLKLTGSSEINGTGNEFSNTIEGNINKNTLSGGGGNDTLTGENGNDTLNGGTGNDILIGGKGKDTAVFSSKSNVVKLNKTKKQNTKDGVDILNGIENINGGKGNDKLIGNNFSNILIGGTGNDLIVGGAGKDELIGGVGKDVLIGGAGKDIFKLSKGKGNDTIKDFEHNQDKIYIGSMKKLKIKKKGKDVYIYQGKDLLAKVKGAAEDFLYKEGKYIV